MITILIAQDEHKIRNILAELLKKEGYAVSGETIARDDVIRISSKNSEKNSASLREKVVELEKTLFKEKKGTIYKSILTEVEKSLIEYVLERTDGNQLKAARILGINRNTMRAKIRKLDINVARWKV